MPRRRREDFPGMWLHAMNRGADRQPIFADELDQRRFLIELREAAYTYDVKVVCYCLMKNHYHLVLFAPSGGVSRAMQRLSSNYTQAFNKRHNRDGALFRLLAEPSGWLSGHSAA